MKVRLSICFNCTVEVLDGSTEDVSIQEAKEAVEAALPYSMDGRYFHDCEIQGVNNITCELL